MAEVFQSLLFVVQASDILHANMVVLHHLSEELRVVLRFAHPVLLLAEPNDYLTFADPFKLYGIIG